MANRNKADLTVRLLGTLIGCVGVWLLVAGVMSLYHELTPWSGWTVLGITLLFACFYFVFGGLAVFVAIRVWRPLTEGMVRLVAGVTALLLWFVVCSLLLTAAQAVSWFPEELTSSLIFTGSAMVVLILYGVYSRRLLLASSVAPPARPLFSKNVVGVACFLLWGFTGDVARDIWPSAFRSPSFFPGVVVAFGPIVLAVLTYKVIVHYIDVLPGLPLVGPPWHRMRRTRLGEVHRERVAKFQCPACAYDVRQTLADHKTYCPECGFDLASVAYPKLPAEIA